MALKFNAKDARKLLAEFRRFLEMVQTASSAAKDLQRQLGRAIWAASERGEYDKAVLSELEFPDGYSKLFLPREAHAIARRYSAIIPAQETLSNFSARMVPRIQSWLEDLEPARSGPQRLFMGSERKDAAERAYDSLRQFRDSGEFELASGAAAQIVGTGAETSAQSSSSAFFSLRAAVEKAQSHGSPVPFP